MALYLQFVWFQETYYIPYCVMNDGSRVLAKGKLISKYYALRKDLKALKVVDDNNSDSSDDEASPGKYCF